MARILVVDDETDVLEALARAFRIADHKVWTASAAADALELSRQHSFDIVILDYLMPGMSGIELLNSIRKYQPTIRSVIVSGKLDVQVSEEAISVELRDRIEADEYLHKPLDNQKLLDTVRDLQGRSEERSWVDIAERNLNAKKGTRQIKDAERSIRGIRRRKKK